MSALLLTNIGSSTTNVAVPGDPCGTLRDAAVLVEDGRIAWVGSAADAPVVREPTSWTSEVGGSSRGSWTATPTSCSAGTGRTSSRHRRIGTPYAAGGIRRTVAATRAATDEELRDRLAGFVRELHAQGTTTLEVKTGYDLTVDGEARLARLAAEVTPKRCSSAGTSCPPSTPTTGMPTSTPCAARCPPRARRSPVGWMCSARAGRSRSTSRVASSRRAVGLLARAHGNQLGFGDGVRLAVEVGACSVDHCTYLSDDDVAMLAASDTVASLLPGVEFSTRQPYPDARRLIDAGVTVILASDCNPGS